MTRIFMIRHGKAAAGWDGDADPGLSELGQAQAEAVDEEPTVLQGDFDFTRSVLIEFPSAEQAMAWMTSPEYQEIAQHRLEASVGNAIMVKKLEMDEAEERLAEKG